MTALVSDPVQFGGTNPGGKGWQQLFPPNRLAPSAYGVEPTWTRRTAITSKNPERRKNSPFLQPCLDWLTSDEARRSTQTVARQYGLHIDIDDILGQATMKIWRQLDARPDMHIDNVTGYCYQIVKRLVVDVLRGKLAGKTVDEKTVADITWYEKAGLSGGGTSSRSAGDIDQVDTVYARLEACGAHPRDVSAALTYVTLAGHSDVDYADLPKSKAGAKPEHALWWPCIWLATHDMTLFPIMDKGSSAQRKRLQRARERADEVLRSAIETQGGGR